jgi:hypothetical protein
MANDDSQSISCALLGDDSQHLNNDTINQSASSTTVSTSNNAKWTFRNSLSTASFRRYRAPFRRSIMSTRTGNSQTSLTPSFPLFRRFYLMHSSLTRKRHRDLTNNINESDALASNEKLSASQRIEASHILTTIFITLASACLLIFMIFLDLAYLNDAFPQAMDRQTLTTNIEHNVSVCFRYPKVCAMKGLVIIIFIGITVILCYTILNLYTRARRHTRLLERKTDELEKEKCLTEKLLHEILPPCVARDLINGRKAPAEYYESVTVYFSDIVGFTIIAR